MTKIATIHERILKKRKHQLEDEIGKKAPEIQKEAMIQEFMKAVNTFKFKERLRLAWRILWRKL